MSTAQKQNRREYWRERIAQHKVSGKTVRAFCEEHQLCEHSFYAWRKELAGGYSSKTKPVSFALVDTTRPPAPAPSLELVLRGGERLYIPAEESILRLVLNALAKAV